jgi:predicted restriction endonuclease
MEKQLSLESEISKLIKFDNGCHTHFEYNKNEDETLKSISVITYNPMKKEEFLLVDITCSDVLDGLTEALNWVRYHTQTETSYTINWSKIGEGKTYKSYFHAKNMKVALEKFYHGKKEHEYSIFEIKQNPIS